MLEFCAAQVDGMQGAASKRRFPEAADPFMGSAMQGDAADHLPPQAELSITCLRLPE
ncbi:MAG TPA: hypothetical protein VHK67_02550 [Rhabdochlamydiaceae bacterium]|nr:hypothetical protein [Rhabdochlamydiaceae bacterium]